MPAASPGQADYRKDFVPALITNLPVANTAAPTWRIRSANRKNHSDRTFSMTQRKLAAILSADAEAYSRLMGADDALTVKTITRSRAIFAACVDNRGGRVVYTPGDAVRAEFPSAVDAVECAMEIQVRLAAANDTLPAARRMRFRIGINLGEIIQEGQ